MTVRHNGLDVSWFGYATVRVAGRESPTVYTDPGRYGVLTGGWEPWGPDVHHPQGPPYAAQDGDIVVVTHDHHYDSDGIRRVAAEDATLVIYEAVDATGIDRDVEPVETLPYETVRVGYGDAITVDGVRIEATPARNDPAGTNVRSDGTPIHPDGLGCGFRFTLGGTPVFWPGDSDALEAHRDLDVTVFLPPIGNFTMDRHAAADLAEGLDPELVVPIHYNTFEALAVQPDGDPGAFAADVAGRGIPVALDATAAGR